MFDKLPVIPYNTYNSRRQSALQDALPVDQQTVQLLAELRFLIADQQLQQCFFVHLVQTSDFWVNTHDVDVMREYWSFIKAIYSQNPVLYNSLFPVSNLVDLMLTVSEAHWDKQCCPYRVETQVRFATQEMGAQGTQASQQPLNSTSHGATLAEGFISVAQGIIPNQHMDHGTLKSARLQSEDQQASRIVEYLEPIAAVLENVLTSGSPEILEQVDTLAKCLTARSSSCFYLQILKLLKVILIDTADRESGHDAATAARSTHFAQRFLAAKGLQILLHLSAHTTAFDVKSLCVKLINDLASQHTSLITMRIDTDLVTYLSNAILPDQLVRQQHHSQRRMLAKSQQRARSTRQTEQLEVKAPGSSEERNRAGSAHGDSNRADSPTQQQHAVKFFNYDEQEQEEDSDQNSVPSHRGKDEVHQQEPLQADASPTEDRPASAGSFQFQQERTGRFNDSGSESGEAAEMRLAQPPAPSRRGRGGGRGGFGGMGGRGGMFSFKDMDGGDSDSGQGSGTPRSSKEDHQSKNESSDGGANSADAKPDFSKTQRMQHGFGSGAGAQKPGARGGFLNIDMSHEETAFQAAKPAFPRQPGAGGGFGRGGLNFAEDSDESPKDDTKPPKATPELLMSRNLRAGGQKRGFDFGFCGGDDSDDSGSSADTRPQSNTRQVKDQDTRMQDNCSPMLQLEDEGGLQLPKNRFAASKQKSANAQTTASEKPTAAQSLGGGGQRHFNLLHKSLKPGLDSEGSRSKESLTASDPQLPPAKTRGQRPNMIASAVHGMGSSSGGSKSGTPTSSRGNQSEASSDGVVGRMIAERERIANQFRREVEREEQQDTNGTGTTGATQDQDQSETEPTVSALERVSASIEDDAPTMSGPPARKGAKQKKTAATRGGGNRRRPPFPMLNTDAINQQFQFGDGDGAELIEAEAIKKLERDIEELANDCVMAMRKYYRRQERENGNRGSYEDELDGNDNQSPFYRNAGLQHNWRKNQNSEGSEKDMFNVPQPIKGIRKAIDLRVACSQDVEDDHVEDQVFAPGNSHPVEADDAAVELAGRQPSAFAHEEDSLRGLPKAANDLELADIIEDDKDVLPQKNRRQMPLMLDSSGSAAGSPEQQSKTATHSNNRMINRGGLVLAGEDDSEFDEDRQSGVERFLLNNTKPKSDPSKEHSNSDPRDQPACEETQENLRLMDEINDLPNATGLQQTNSFLGSQAVDFTQELENLYTSCLEWTLKRRPVGLSKTIMIDDYDHITFQPAMQMLMTVVTYSSNLVRQRALQDMFMLAQLNNQNGQILLQHPQFHTWLLQLLMPYQDLAGIKTESALSESSRAVYDMGCKLHTLLLKNVCTTPDESGYKKVNLLTRWPSIVALQIAQAETAETGPSPPSLHIYRDWDVDTAHSLTRVLLTSIISSMKDETTLASPLSEVIQSSVWRNIVHITLQVEELMLSSHSMTSSGLSEQTNQPGRVGDVNESLLRWVQRDYLLNWESTGNNTLWAEWDLAEALLRVVEKLFPASMFQGSSVQDAATTSSSIEQEQKMFLDLLQSKENQDNHQAYIELLMHEVVPSQSQSPSTGSGGFGARFNLFGQNNNGSSSGRQQDCDTNFMKALINILCLTINQTDLKDVTAVWLDRLERFVKLLLIVSANWTNKNQAYYQQVQRKIADAVAFALTFLFHEVHQPDTPTSQNKKAGTPNSAHLSEHSSTKQFGESLKRLVVFVVNVVHYTDLFRKKTSSGAPSASKILLQTVLVKQYGTSGEPLISEADVQRLKESRFEELPECFYQSDWKVTFFHSAGLAALVENQISVALLGSFMARRQQYAQHVLEVESKAEKAKQQILEKMQAETVEAISALSDAEYERKNKAMYLVDASLRERLAARRGNQRQVRGPRGIWREEGTAQPALGVSKYIASDGSRSFMRERATNGFELLATGEEGKELEDRLMLKVQRTQTDMTHVPEGESCDLTKLAAQLPTDGKSNNTLSTKTKNNFDKDKDRQDDSEEQDQDTDEDPHTANEDEAKAKLGSLAKPGTQASPKQEVLAVKHFSNRLTARQRLDLQSFHTKYMQEHIASQQPGQGQKGGTKRKIIIEGRCEVLTAMRKKPATLIVTNIELAFVYDLVTTTPDGLAVADDRDVMLFGWTPPSDKLLHKVIPLSYVKEIQRRRWLGQRNALELFMIDGTQIMLNFENTDLRNEFAKKIIRQRNCKCKNLNYYASLDPKRILKKRGLTEEWVNWRISNFEYLMHLNLLTGRSYNDMSQYPVMPWILAHFASASKPDLKALNPVARGGAPPGAFRDLTKNMQLLGSAERQAEFQRKYDDADGFLGVDDRFHCGSHYSSPGIVLHYLARVHPFIEGAVELHGKQFDQPDRAFASLEGSLKNSLNDSSDVRELIPEFYFLPEMFLNLNRCNFGRKQDGQGEKVEDVSLPQWVQGDAYRLVQHFREAIESPYVSSNLHSWIDYIYGCKQRGQEAVMSLNTFSKMTYTTDSPEDFNILDTEDEGMRQAQMAQMYHFGQTPTQLFKAGERHPARLPVGQVLRTSLVVDSEARLKVFKPVCNQQAAVHGRAGQPQPPTPGVISNEAILKVRFVSEEKIVGATKEGYAQQFIWMLRMHDMAQTTPFLLGGERKSKFHDKTREGGIDQVDRSIRRHDFPLLILNEGKTVVKGGYWGGKIKFCPVDGGPTLPPFELKGHQTTVCAMAVDSKEQVLVTGSKSGEVLVWKNVNFDNSWETLSSSSASAGKPCNQQIGTSNPWALYRELCDHDRQISSIFMSEPMCMFATSSHDGTVNLYNLHSIELLRTFKHPTMAPIYSVVLAQNPLAVCAFFSREDHLWNAYSINGRLLTDLKKISQTGSQQELAHMTKLLTEECSHVVSPIVVKDSFFMDKLVYGTEKGHIMLRSLPTLTRFRRLLASNNHPVLTISVSPDRRFLHVGCGDGGIIVITEHGAQSAGQQATGAQRPSTQAGSSQTRPSSGMLTSQGSQDSVSTNKESRPGTAVSQSSGTGTSTGILSSLSNFVSRSGNQSHRQNNNNKR